RRRIVAVPLEHLFEDFRHAHAHAEVREGVAAVRSNGGRTIERRHAAGSRPSSTRKASASFSYCASWLYACAAMRTNPEGRPAQGTMGTWMAWRRSSRSCNSSGEGLAGVTS